VGGSFGFEKYSGAAWLYAWLVEAGINIISMNALKKS